MSDFLKNDIQDSDLVFNDSGFSPDEYVVIDDKQFSLDAFRSKFNDPDLPFEGITIFNFHDAVMTASLLSGFGVTGTLYVVQAEAYFEFLDCPDTEFHRQAVGHY